MITNQWRRATGCRSARSGGWGQGGGLARTRRRAVLIIAVVLLAPAGCALLPPTAVRQIRLAHDAYRAREFTRAAELVSPVIREHPNSPEIAEALYLRALCNVQTRRRVAASTDLEKALARSGRPELTALIRAQLGNLAFDDETYARAADFYGQAKGDLPPKPPTDQILYQYGVSLQRSGRFTDAKFAFADVFTRFPQSPYAAPARRKYQWRRPYFAVQCGAFTTVTLARELAQDLKVRGFEVRILREARGQSELYVVRSGKHRTYAEAVQAAHALRPIVHDVFVVP
ncbi:MAG: outer membrane protein assembly factor BamD [Phycisphaerales bacterium]|nr:MAG: outer membrane protein assembly factor BamD [Phycisphaerales bacterium]